MYFSIKWTVFSGNKKAPSKNSESAMVNLGQRVFGLKEWPKIKNQPRIHRGGWLLFSSKSGPKDPWVRIRVSR